MNQIKKYNFVKEQGVPCSFILEYNKEVSASDVFAVVRSNTTDDDIVAEFKVVKIENTDADADVTSTFKLTLDGDITPGRYVYDVFIYDSNNKPKSKILKGHFLVKGSVSDRGRLNADSSA